MLAAVLLTAASACSGGGNGNPAASARATGPAASGQGPPGAAPTASGPGSPRVVPMTLGGGRAHIELTALSRTSARAVTGQFKISNDGPSELTIDTALYEATESQQNYNAASGIGLLDGTGNKLYMPLRTTNDKCLCSDLSGKVLPPNGSADLYAVFPAPPADVTRVSVIMPFTVPFQDVPVASGPVRPLPDQKIDPATASLAPPRILPVIATVEGDRESTDDSAGERTVRLSSDVLFALNKANLSAQASALLEGVARQISQSTGTTVRVDGYTDSTGNDTINQPLSQRRAQTVAQRLKSLVTRQGVTFQVAGHGSRDPVASNGTGEGRRKNRRTTVTFTLPVPRPAATPASGRPYTWTKGTPAVVASAPFSPPEAKGLKIEVNGLHRDASGLTTLVWTVRNDSGALMTVAGRFDSYRYYSTSNVDTALGLELVDTAGKLRYQPLRTSENRCLCYDFNRVGARVQVRPGDVATFGDVYKLPPDLQTVDLQVPWSGSPGATVRDLAVK